MIYARLVFWVLFVAALLFFVICAGLSAVHDTRCQDQCIADGYDSGKACRGDDYENICRCMMETKVPERN